MPTAAAMQRAFNAGLVGDDATFAADLWDVLYPLIDAYIDNALRPLRVNQALADGEPPRDNFMFRELLSRATYNMERGLEPWDGMEWNDQQTIRALRTFVVGRKEPKPSKAARRAARSETPKPVALADINRRTRRAL